MKMIKKKKQITIKKNEDQVLYKNQIKLNVEGWNWRKKSTKDKQQNK